MTSRLWRAQFGAIWPRLGVRLLRLGAAFGLGAAVIFGGNGLSPRGFVHILGTSWAARLGLWLLWLIPFAHATRVIWDAPEALLLRTWPLSRARLLVVPLALLGYVELPWALLLGLGGGPICGLTGAIAAVGAHALVFAGIRTIADALAAALLAAAILLVPGHPLALLAAMPAAAIAVLAAWDRGGERRRPRTFRWARGLTGANLAAVLRQEGALLVRAFLLAGMGGGMALLGARNNDVARVASLVRIVLAVGAVTLTVALAGAAAATQRVDARDGWLLHLSGAGLRRRRRAAAFAVALLGLVIGAIHGLVGGVGNVRAALSAAALVGALVTGIVWRSSSFERMLLALIGAIVATCVVCALTGEIALAPLALLAALLIA